MQLKVQGSARKCLRDQNESDEIIWLIKFFTCFVNRYNCLNGFDVLPGDNSNELSIPGGYARNSFVIPEDSVV